MTDLYFLTLTGINIFVLVFMCVLVRLNTTLNPEQAKGFLATFILIGIICILELITVLVDGTAVWLRPVNILANYFGFGLTPAVPLLMIYTLKSPERDSRSLKIAVVVEIIYMLLLLVSLAFGGLVFRVDSSNHYFRERGFHIYMIMYYAGIVLLLYNMLEMARIFQNCGRELIYSLSAFIAIGTLVQILIPEIHITWLCVTLIAVLFYLYCNEMWNQLDGLTGLLSQKSYINKTINHCSEDMLIVMDLDDFKYINDTYGHLEGDKCLRMIAKCLKTAYSEYGNCYRIGGDEFCVLLKDNKREISCKEKFYRILEKQRVKNPLLPEVSYGSALISKEESILDAKARADKNMYEDKKAHKLKKSQSESSVFAQQR